MRRDEDGERESVCVVVVVEGNEEKRRGQPEL